ncbi:MAG: hypothetical protein ACFBSD_09420 [Paracoccaceae bacterium]
MPSPATEPILIDIATTGGPSTLRNAEFDDEAAQSAVVLFDQSHIPVGVDPHFDAFDRKIRRWLRGRGLTVPETPLILELDRRIDAGQSWQLGHLVAQCVLAKGQLATAEAQARRLFFVTGAIGMADWTARPVEGVTRKLERARNRLESLAAGGLTVEIVVPEGNFDEALEAAPEGIPVHGVGALGPLVDALSGGAAEPRRPWRRGALLGLGALALAGGVGATVVFWDQPHAVDDPVAWAYGLSLPDRPPERAREPAPWRAPQDPHAEAIAPGPALVALLPPAAPGPLAETPPPTWTEPPATPPLETLGPRRTDRPALPGETGAQPEPPAALSARTAILRANSTRLADAPAAPRFDTAARLWPPGPVPGAPPAPGRPDRIAEAEARIGGPLQFQRPETLSGAPDRRAPEDRPDAPTTAAAPEAPPAVPGPTPRRPLRLAAPGPDAASLPVPEGLTARPVASDPGALATVAPPAALPTIPAVPWPAAPIGGPTEVTNPLPRLLAADPLRAWPKPAGPAIEDLATEFAGLAQIGDVPAGPAPAEIRLRAPSAVDAAPERGIPAALAAIDPGPTALPSPLARPLPDPELVARLEQAPVGLTCRQLDFGGRPAEPIPFVLTVQTQRLTVGPAICGFQLEIGREAGDKREAVIMAETDPPGMPGIAVARPDGAGRLQITLSPWRFIQVGQAADLVLTLRWRDPDGRDAAQTHRIRLVPGARSPF